MSRPTVGTSKSINISVLSTLWWLRSRYLGLLLFRLNPTSLQIPRRLRGKGRMQISVVGAGYVGLTTAACLAEIGQQVFCTDNDLDKLERLNSGRLPRREAQSSSVLALRHWRTVKRISAHLSPSRARLSRQRMDIAWSLKRAPFRCKPRNVSGSISLFTTLMAWILTLCLTRSFSAKDLRLEIFFTLIVSLLERNLRVPSR